MQIGTIAAADLFVRGRLVSNRVGGLRYDCCTDGFIQSY